MSLIRIQSSLLEETSKVAASSERKRTNHNFHQPEDTLQRFLNAVEPGSYVCPHCHISPPIPEIMILLKGKAGVVTFDQTGNMDAIIMLDPEQGSFGVEIPASVYHTLFSLEAGTVFYEIKEGPYKPDVAKYFAPWAPREGEAGVAEYLKSLEAEFHQRLE